MAFKVQLIGEGASTRVELLDTTNNALVEVYAFGALLNKFLLQHPQGTLNVIDGYESPEEAVNDITPLFKSAKLSPFVCRTKNATYKFGNEQYKLNKYFHKQNAIHGLLYDKVFDVIETSDSGNAASVKLQYEYNNNEKGYPFSYRCTVSYFLEPGNKLSITTQVENTDNKLIPIADGWHPYFTLGNKVDDCQLEFQSKEMLVFDDELVPTGEKQRYEEFGSLKLVGKEAIDNCFTLNFAECQPMCVFRNPALNIQLEIHPDRSYPYLQFYTPDHRNSIAIENLSAAPDAFNNTMGLHVLEPGQSISFLTSYVLKSL